MAQQIRDVMTPEPKVLDIDCSIAEAARVMRDNDIGMLVVRSNKGVVGVVTDRDLVVRGLAECEDPNTTTLADVYSEQLVVLEANDSIENAINLMRRKAIRRLPVMQNGEVVGVVSLGDLALERDPNSVLGQISAAPANH
jgi:CBS domain-containing protein